jgi:hypothetical protein
MLYNYLFAERCNFNFFSSETERPSGPPPALGAWNFAAHATI